MKGINPSSTSVDNLLQASYNVILLSFFFHLIFLYLSCISHSLQLLSSYSVSPNSFVCMHKKRKSKWVDRVEGILNFDLTSSTHRHRFCQTIIYLYLYLNIDAIYCIELPIDTSSLPHHMTYSKIQKNNPVLGGNTLAYQLSKFNRFHISPSFPKVDFANSVVYRRDIEPLLKSHQTLSKNIPNSFVFRKVTKVESLTFKKGICP